MKISSTKKAHERMAALERELLEAGCTNQSFAQHEEWSKDVVGSETDDLDKSENRPIPHLFELIPFVRGGRGKRGPTESEPNECTKPD